MKTIIFSSGMIVGALIVLANQPGWLAGVYCSMSAAFFTVVVWGGVRQHFSQEAVDFRDMAKEKDAMLKAKISALQEELIEKEKMLNHARK
jgi:hypothetical protein